MPRLCHPRPACANLWAILGKRGAITCIMLLFPTLRDEIKKIFPSRARRDYWKSKGKKRRHPCKLLILRNIIRFMQVSMAMHSAMGSLLHPNFTRRDLFQSSGIRFLEEPGFLNPAHPRSCVRKNVRSALQEAGASQTGVSQAEAHSRQLKSRIVLIC